jgi:hypothetical protein
MTGEGVQLTKHPQFAELIELRRWARRTNGHVTVRVSFIANGFTDRTCRDEGQGLRHPG